MPKYTIDGKTYSSPTPLSDDELMELSGGSAPAPSSQTQAAPVAPQTAPAPRKLTNDSVYSDPQWLRNAKTLYGEIEKQPFKGSDKEAADWLKNYMGQFNYNLAATGKTAYDATSMTDAGKKALLSSINDYDSLPSFTMEGAGRLAKGIATDPTTYLGLGVGSVLTKTAGRTALKEGAKQALKEGIEAGAKKTMLEKLAASGSKFLPTSGAAIEGGIYAGAGNVATQAAKVNADGQESIDPVEAAKSAAFGLVGGAAANKVVDKVTGRSALRNFVKDAGSEEGARVKAEVAQDFRPIAENPNFLRTDANGEAKVAAVMRNEQNKSYIGEVQNALNRVDPGVLKKYDVENTLKKQRTITPEKLEALRSEPNGGVLADAIEKYQIANSVTGPTEASGTLGAKATRFGIEYAPKVAASVIGGTAAGPTGLLAGLITPRTPSGWAQRFTGKQTIPERIAGLTSDANMGASKTVLDLLGPSKASQGALDIAELARKADASKAAKAAANQQAKEANIAAREATTQAAEQLRIRNLELGVRSSPVFKPDADIGGGVRGTLQYYGRLADSKELAKGLRIIESTDPYLAKQIELIKQNKTDRVNLNQEVLTGLTDRLLLLREQGVLKPFMKESK